MEQNNGAIVFRPSWKNYILWFMLIFLIITVMGVTAFGGFEEGFEKIVYAAGMTGVVYVIAKIMLDMLGGRFTWKNYLWRFMLIFSIIAVMILIISLVFGAGMDTAFYWAGTLGILFIGAKVMLDRFDERFTMKEDKVAVEHGLLHKKSTEMGIRQIRTIQVNQKLWQRIFNIGDIFIGSAATRDYEIVAHGISNPHNVKEKLQSYKSDASEKKKTVSAEPDAPQEEAETQE
ncbi:MAG: PH domain-containing protein [Synergistaceae bacterium]|nr:PH domain-containing protein [Synergistaceae bacterium]